MAPHFQYFRNINTAAECGRETCSRVRAHNVSNFEGSISTHKALTLYYSNLQLPNSFCPNRYKDISVIQRDHGLIYIIVTVTSFSSGNLITSHWKEVHFALGWNFTFHFIHSNKQYHYWVIVMCHYPLNYLPGHFLLSPFYRRKDRWAQRC